MTRDIWQLSRKDMGAESKRKETPLVTSRSGQKQKGQRGHGKFKGKKIDVKDKRCAGRPIYHNEKGKSVVWGINAWRRIADMNAETCTKLRGRIAHPERCLARRIIGRRERWGES